ncbi:MAG: LicD family protein [Lachnospiraceae bacterium]|nr:LicD family protein [Lachnospiraceae bacterium]
MNFDKHFFEKEEREGFAVEEMMKRAWAAALEVLEVVKGVCEKHNIKYYAAYGTLLGAVRHKGYIPWDDDIDICMLREDYDRFVAIADRELPEGFVLTGIYGKEPRLWEANGDAFQARVMADEEFFTLPEYMSYFHGFPYMRIGIDIFPLDYLPSDAVIQYELVELFTEINILLAKWDEYKNNLTLEEHTAPIYTRLKSLSGNEDGNFNIGNDVFKKHYLRLCMDKIVSSMQYVDRNNVVVIQDLPCPKNRDAFHGFECMKTEWFSDTIKLNFESTQVIAPVKYSQVLEVWFGKDYMIPKKFAAEHGYPFYRHQETAFRKMLLEAGIKISVDEFCRNWSSLLERK